MIQVRMDKDDFGYDKTSWRGLEIFKVLKQLSYLSLRNLHLCEGKYPAITRVNQDRIYVFHKYAIEGAFIPSQQ